MKVSEIRRQFLLFEYERDDRCCPNNRRRGQFRAGWRRGQVSEQTLKEHLTWHNLGYRIEVEHFGSQAKERIDKVFQDTCCKNTRRSDRLQAAVETACFLMRSKEASSAERRSRNAKSLVNASSELQATVATPDPVQLSKYGTRCCICDFSFGDKYGKDLRQDFIHVHHRRSACGDR